MSQINYTVHCGSTTLLVTTGWDVQTHGFFLDLTNLGDPVNERTGERPLRLSLGFIPRIDSIRALRNGIHAAGYNPALLTHDAEGMLRDHRASSDTGLYRLGEVTR